MHIKQIHAHFLISIGNYSNERIGFTVELEAEEAVETVVAELRQKAIAAVGPLAEELYEQKHQLERTCRELHQRLEKLKTEWDATAEFLRAQGIKPEAPSMPQFNNLLSAAKPEETVIEGQFEPTPF